MLRNSGLRNPRDAASMALTPFASQVQPVAEASQYGARDLYPDLAQRIPGLVNSGFDVHVVAGEFTVLPGRVRRIEAKAPDKMKQAMPRGLPRPQRASNQVVVDQQHREQQGEIDNRITESALGEAVAVARVQRDRVADVNRTEHAGRGKIQPAAHADRERPAATLRTGSAIKAAPAAGCSACHE